MSETKAYGPAIGESAEADFEKGTWTFEMVGDYKVAAGRHVIVREQEFKRLTDAICALLGAAKDFSEAMILCSDYPDMQTERDALRLAVEKARSAIAKAEGGAA